MTNEIIEKLLPKVKSVCPPDLELSVKEFPLSSTRVLYLFIIKYDKEFDDVESMFRFLLQRYSRDGGLV